MGFTGDSHGSISIMGIIPEDTPPVGILDFSGPFSRGGFTSNQSVRRFAMPFSCTLSRFFVKHNLNQDVLPMRCTVNLDGINTTLTLNIPVGGGTSPTSNIVDSFHCNAGQDISFEFDSPATSIASAIRSIAVMVIAD